MGIARTADEFPDVLRDVFSYGVTIMVEQFIDGQELTCGVLDTEEDEPPFALPVTSINPVNSPFFDYHAKYTPGATEEITPAAIDDDIRDRVQEIAVRAHTAVGCSGFSRSDLFLTPEGGLVWIEVNTIPGLTETSLFPQGAAATGIPFSEMVEKLVDAAAY